MGAAAFPGFPATSAVQQHRADLSEGDGSAVTGGHNSVFSEGNERAITAGERAYLERRLHAKGWSIATALQVAGLQPGAGLDDLTRSGVAALLAATA